MKETHLRHAFLIIAHKDPELLIDLVRLVYGENRCVLVNIDRKSKQLGGGKSSDFILCPRSDIYRL